MSLVKVKNLMVLETVVKLSTSKEMARTELVKEPSTIMHTKSLSAWNISKMMRLMVIRLRSSILM